MSYFHIHLSPLLSRKTFAKLIGSAIMCLYSQSRKLCFNIDSPISRGMTVGGAEIDSGACCSHTRPKEPLAFERCETDGYALWHL